ncbi:SCP2 sterol-binding domain-containing protein [Streptomyces sp. GC420]|uniref:SCP2 sterol-binding domain-containing protein n=1 Tax=Streptomyces sp. GC420 TaxID=2697568 RepID=UPI001AA0E83C|nr:SCP2 sterol-binding domain-containing protein [Streptomyces sp. GC420]
MPVGSREWWLVIKTAQADVCDMDPGYDVSVTVSAALRPMVRIWRGDLGWSEALRTGALAVEGPERLRRALPDWFALPAVAAVPRPS